MATFKFTGDFDDVSAKLKASFEAEQANFNAGLNKMFKPAESKAPAAPAPAAPAPGKRPVVGSAPAVGRRPVVGSAPAAGMRPAAGSAPAAGMRPAVGSALDTSCSLSSRRNDDDSLRGRMRNSLRTKPR